MKNCKGTVPGVEWLEQIWEVKKMGLRGMTGSRLVAENRSVLLLFCVLWEGPILVVVVFARGASDMAI